MFITLLYPSLCWNDAEPGWSIIPYFFSYYVSSHMSIIWHAGLLFSLAERGIFAYDGLRSKGVVGQFFSARWRGKEKLTLIWQDDAFSHMLIFWHDGLLSSLARSDVC